MGRHLASLLQGVAFPPPPKLRQPTASFLGNPFTLWPVDKKGCVILSESLAEGDTRCALDCDTDQISASGAFLVFPSTLALPRETPLILLGDGLGSGLARRQTHTRRRAGRGKTWPLTPRPLIRKTAPCS